MRQDEEGGRRVRKRSSLCSVVCSSNIEDWESHSSFARTLVLQSFLCRPLVTTEQLGSNKTAHKVQRGSAAAAAAGKGLVGDLEREKSSWELMEEKRAVNIVCGAPLKGINIYEDEKKNITAGKALADPFKWFIIFAQLLRVNIQNEGRVKEKLPWPSKLCLPPPPTLWGLQLGWGGVCWEVYYCRQWVVEQHQRDGKCREISPQCSFFF